MFITPESRSWSLFYSKEQRSEKEENRRLKSVGPLERTASLLMDRAYEDDKTRLAARCLRFNPVVPPKKNRVKPWDYDRELYRRLNEVERFFQRLKGFRCVCTRYDKLDRMFAAFIWLACICIALRSVNTP
jgi:transposase